MTLPRAYIEAQYDALLADFYIGEYGHVELEEGETKQTVRNRLVAAAERRGLKLIFFRTSGPILQFRIEIDEREELFPEEAEARAISDLSADKDETGLNLGNPPLIEEEVTA